MTREQLNQSLPHGALKEIAEQVGVHYSTVSRFLKYENMKNTKIEIAVLEYVIKLEKRKAELYKELQSL